MEDGYDRRTNEHLQGSCDRYGCNSKEIAVVEPYGEDGRGVECEESSYLEAVIQ